MARETGPKRFRRQLRYFAAGASVTVDDDRLADVLYLANHPQWTWRDLEETPEDVLACLRILERAQAEHREK